MLPVITLVGRPNVGKSTLFNCLTRTRDALVADQPGLTRDRNYGTARIGQRRCLIVDTGGLVERADGIEELASRQVELAIDEADVALLVTDAREGLGGPDENIAQQLRRTGKPTVVVVNKTDGLDEAIATAEFHALGLGEPVPIAAVHGRGLNRLSAIVAEYLPDAEAAEECAGGQGENSTGIQVAVAGRPNVGKSTLINRMLGEERVLVFDEPGTTRDSIFIPFERDGQDYVLIDTAGVRRRSRIHAAIEKFSVIKTLQAIEQANVVIFVLDAWQGVADQDATLLGYVIASGRALVLSINKWDGLSSEQRQRIRQELDRHLPFLDFAPRHYISALHGSGVGDLFPAVQKAYLAATRDLSTPELTRILKQAVDAHPPPLVRGRRIKLRYAHQGGRNPPRIVIHGTQTKELPDSYRRYLSNTFRETLTITGTPVLLEFKSGENPFRGRRNVLTPRQVRQRKRIRKRSSK